MVSLRWEGCGVSLRCEECGVSEVGGVWCV